MHHQLYIERRERGLHQQDVAKVLGIHRQTYYEKEKGRTDFSLREAKMLAIFFDTTLDNLFGEVRDSGCKERTSSTKI